MPLPAVLVLLLLIVGAAVLAYLPLTLTPSPVPANGPTHQFSAERAVTDLQRLASRPRPMGSAAHQEAVSTIQDELVALGVESEVVEKVVARPDFGTVFAARLRNVIARIPGTDSTGAVLLMSHFNSVPTSPAANDGGLGVVTALETIRALRAAGPVRNDIIVWFGDADETTAMNTEALTDHRWFQDVELALAFEGIGTRGPSLLSFAGAGHPGTPLPPQAVGESTGVQFSGGSFSTDEGRWLRDALEVLSRPVPVLPLNDVALGASPDLATAVAGTDVAALSFAQIGDTSGYHTDLDRPDRTSLGSLQSSGDSALALVRHFGAFDFTAPASTGGLVAFSAGPGWTLAYPVSWALPLAAAAGILVVVAVVVGRRRHVLALTGVLSGILACAVGMVLAAALAAAVTVVLEPEVHFARNPYGYGWRMLLLVALGLVCSAAVYLVAARLLRTTPRDLGMVAGPLVVLTVAAVVTAAVLPAASYVFTWPAVAAAALLAWRVLAPPQTERPWALTAGLTVVGVVVAIAAVPVVYLLASGTSVLQPMFAAVITVVVVLLGGALTAHFLLLARRRWVIPAVLLATAGTLGIASQVAAGFNTERPRPDYIEYALDAETDRAQWISAGTAPDDWTEQFYPEGFSADQLAFSPGYFFGQSIDVITAPAPSLELAPPEVKLIEERTENGVRTVTMRLTSPRGAPTAHLDLDLPGDLVAADVEGQDLLVPEGRPVRELPITAYNVDQEGMQITVSTRGAGPITGTLTDYSNGLPTVSGVTIRPRPADHMPAPYDFRDPTSVRTSVRM
ncbi:M28 family peptidase [Kocuria aegyptia]|uniref:M20/M25/M40 family metallo-hydrolase n=1 Tax=Kocuria aegyptia TaxID=330943 RepID=A0ABP4WBW8_9MICC